MRFVPHYTVSYHGKFYRAGVELEIEQCDVENMTKHGKVVGEKPSEDIPQAVAATAEVEKPVRKAGRPRKQQ